MNEYRELLDDIKWSFSTVHLYDKCPYAFYLKKIESVTGDTNAYAEIGSYGHELNEQIFKGEYTVEQALEKCIKEFDDHVFEYISESSRDKKYTALCDYLTVFDEKYNENYEVVAVELKVEWKIGRYNCIGYIDLVLRRKSDGAILLIDHKSAPHFLKKDGTPLKNQRENFEAYRNQMYIYADAMKKTMGYYPDLIIWNHFLDDAKTSVIQFEETQLNHSVEWFEKTIDKIYEDTQFEAILNYMMCFQLCNYRNGLCEYKDMDREEGD